LMTTSTREPR